MGRRRPLALRIQPPVPFGEVILVPAPLSGQPATDMAWAMAGAIDTPSAAAVRTRLHRPAFGGLLGRRLAAFASFSGRRRLVS